ncbi:hypothetical protein [Pseudooceanicola sp. LIPI14-2-Ac024]|uniref:hypothetical protein n=1 Tax=Pseudooceanicola sp. LIPI14-2-Ac024 TaxID=3344875 RepID=UPI0035D0735D
MAADPREILPYFVVFGVTRMSHLAMLAEVYADKPVIKAGLETGGTSDDIEFDDAGG